MKNILVLLLLSWSNTSLLDELAGLTTAGLYISVISTAEAQVRAQLFLFYCLHIGGQNSKCQMLLLITKWPTSSSKPV